MTTTVTHIAGVAIRFGSHRRQRCSWCGYVIEDVDLDRVMVQVREGEEPRGLPEWPFESLIEVTADPHGSRMMTVIDDGSLERHDDGSVKVPENCCLRVPAELTLEVGKCLNSVP